MNARYQKSLKRLAVGLAIPFAAVNVMAALHAYHFTHFEDDGKPVSDPRRGLNWKETLKMAFTGIRIPRPVNTKAPSTPYKTVYVESNKRLECWLMHTSAAKKKGTVICFHGYTGSKTSMLSRAAIYTKAGYDVLLPDFMGSGGSEGKQTTIGFREAEEVKSCFDYVSASGEDNIYLAGTSLGAVAILKAMDDYQLSAKALILECPFSTMYHTVAARFEMLKIPSFPMAGLMMFWGGLENGFWAFGHNPKDYAKSITTPTLLIWGQKDDRVCETEISVIAKNLQGPKKVITFPKAGHDDFLARSRADWERETTGFLAQHP